MGQIGVAREKETALKAVCCAADQNRVQRGKKAISPQYTSIVQTEATLLEDSRNSADSRSQQRSTELIIYEVSLPVSLKQKQ